LLGTYYDSQGKDYVLSIVMHLMYACKRASDYALTTLNILQFKSSSMGNVLFMFTRASARVRASVCDRACATERVVKHSLIYGPTLFKFSVNILQITTSSMGYVLFMITHRMHACERARANARVRASA
jgi:hypothetical protein